LARNPGKPLSFGSLLIVRAGIRCGEQVLTWEKIEDAQEKNGWLTLKIEGKRRGWQSVDQHQRYLLSNLPLIVELTKHAMRSRLVGVLATYAQSSWKRLPETAE
jgi:hypothetical protein